MRQKIVASLDGREWDLDPEGENESEVIEIFISKHNLKKGDVIFIGKYLNDCISNEVMVTIEHRSTVISKEVK